MFWQERFSSAAPSRELIWLSTSRVREEGPKCRTYTQGVWLEGRGGDEDGGGGGGGEDLVGSSVDLLASWLWTIGGALAAPRWCQIKPPSRRHVTFLRSPASSCLLMYFQTASFPPFSSSVMFFTASLLGRFFCFFDVDDDESVLLFASWMHIVFFLLKPYLSLWDSRIWFLLNPNIRISTMKTRFLRSARNIQCNYWIQVSVTPSTKSIILISVTAFCLWTMFMHWVLKYISHKAFQSTRTHGCSDDSHCLTLKLWDLSFVFRCEIWVWCWWTSQTS